MASLPLSGICRLLIGLFDVTCSSFCNVQKLWDLLDVCSFLAGAVELRNAVASQFGVELPATVTFDYPTIAALAGFISLQIAPSTAAAAIRPGGRARVEEQRILQELLDIASGETALELVRAISNRWH